MLRRYYSRPYFLPPLSESSRTDWIFMGTSGLGAHMHVNIQITVNLNWSNDPALVVHT